jgi:hypothetical protein
MRCAHCEGEFTPKNIRGRFCSARCRAAAWQANRAQREDRLKGLVKVLAKEAGLTAEDFA